MSRGGHDIDLVHRQRGLVRAFPRTPSPEEIEARTLREQEKHRQAILDHALDIDRIYEFCERA